MTIDRCKNSNESWITKLQIKSESGKYIDLNDTEMYNVVTISYKAEKLKEKYGDEISRTEGTDLQTDVLKEYIENRGPTEAKKQSRINILNCNEQGSEERLVIPAILGKRRAWREIQILILGLVIESLSL